MQSVEIIANDKVLTSVDQSVTTNAVEYGEAEYWNKRYVEEGEDVTYDWLESWEELKELTFENAVNDKVKASELKVLNLGCGNSIVSEDMYDDGIK